MASKTSKTKTIAKNAVFLYIRMIIVTFITLFTSRVVLRELGIEDYGLYNVVGGVVALFAFLRSSMNSSTQRFLSYEMGKGNYDNLRNTFSICLSAHVLIAFILLVLAETIGLWFLNTRIVIPDGRIEAANWIYQFSVASLCVGIVSVPYSADIVSNEKMGYFAFLGVLNAVLKLVIAYMIIISPTDRLVFYGFLMMFINVIDLVLNLGYCHKKYPETHYKFYWDKESFKKVFSFSGWTIWGQLAIVGSNQGTNILVNMFYTVTANAAMGVGSQVNHAITGLVSNFQTAFKPQITKSYAEGNYDYLNRLTVYSSKLSFFLLFLVSFPIVMNINIVLSLWLGNVPEYASELCIIFIFASLCNAISAPLWMNVFATGNIKDYQIAMSIAFVIELIIVYLLFSCGVSLVQGVMMKSILNFIVIFLRLYYTHKEVEAFDCKKFICKSVAPLLTICILSYFFVFAFIGDLTSIYAKIIATCLVEILLCIICFQFGLDKQEKKILEKIINKYNKQTEIL